MEPTSRFAPSLPTPAYPTVLITFPGAGQDKQKVPASYRRRALIWLTVSGHDQLALKQEHRDRRV